jgi:hypothetical protein
VVEEVGVEVPKVVVEVPKVGVEEVGVEEVGVEEVGVEVPKVIPSGIILLYLIQNIELVIFGSEFPHPVDVCNKDQSLLKDHIVEINL